MSTSLRLRKIDFITPVACPTLALQRIHGSSCRTYWLKQALVAAGWTVYYSSTGLTSDTSDLWGSSAFQAVVLQNYADSGNTTGTVDGIWSCLRSPTADAKGDYLHICLSPSHAQWSDPVVRNTTNAMNGAASVGTCNMNWLSGLYHGFLRIGMTLSSSATAFSGGTTFSSASSALARGDLPTAPGAFWTTRNIGCGATANGLLSLTVSTDGNQFFVMEDGSTTTASLFTNRYWWGLSSMANGGYAVFEQGTNPNATTIGTLKGQELSGGRACQYPGYSAADMPTTLGGWRTGYIKRDSGTVISGGLACPEPAGFEAVVDQPTFTTNARFPTTIQLQAVSCTDPAHFNLGNFSDFILMGNTRITDNTLLRNTASQSQWYAFKEAKAYLMKWDVLDNPALRTVVIPPNSVV